MKTRSCDDNLQTYRYSCVAPVGKNFAEQFTPDLTPAQMLELGVFGGHYFEGYHHEYPAEWFTNAKISHTHNPQMNFFEIDASQSREEWIQKGWMSDDDPRGWFQWYCRYYLGRRLGAEDDRQIGRWKAIARHVGQIRANCSPGDITCRRRQRQALLHWAYDSRRI